MTSYKLAKATTPLGSSVMTLFSTFLIFGWYLKVLGKFRKVQCTIEISLDTTQRQQQFPKYIPQVPFSPDIGEYVSFSKRMDQWKKQILHHIREDLRKVTQCKHFLLSASHKCTSKQSLGDTMLSNDIVSVQHVLHLHIFTWEEVLTNKQSTLKDLKHLSLKSRLSRSF